MAFTLDKKTDIKLDRKELKRPDAFLANTAIAVQWMQRNFKFLIGILLIACVSGAGFGLYTSYRNQKNEQASLAFFQARKDFLTAFEKAPKTDSAWDQKLQTEISRIEKVSKDFPRTWAALEGLLLLGDVYYDRGNPTKAAEFYKKGADLAPNKELKGFAQYSAAYAYENAKLYDLAIENLQQVVNANIKTLKADSLLALGRLYELKGDKAKAMQNYSQAILEAPNSSTAKTAEIFKNQIQK